MRGSSSGVLDGYVLSDLDIYPGKASLIDWASASLHSSSQWMWLITTLRVSDQKAGTLGQGVQEKGRLRYAEQPHRRAVYRCRDEALRHRTG